MKIKMVCRDVTADAVIDTKSCEFNFAENGQGVVLTLRNRRAFGFKFVILYIPCETAEKAAFVKRCFEAVRFGDKNGKRGLFDDLRAITADVALMEDRLIFTAINGLRCKTTRLLNIVEGQEGVEPLLLYRIVENFRKAVYGRNVKRVAK